MEGSVGYSAGARVTCTIQVSNTLEVSLIVHDKLTQSQKLEHSIVDCY
jgi:hypothetical protein